MEEISFAGLGQIYICPKTEDGMPDMSKLKPIELSHKPFPKEGILSPFPIGSTKDIRPTIIPTDLPKPKSWTFTMEGAVTGDLHNLFDEEQLFDLHIKPSLYGEYLPRKMKKAARVGNTYSRDTKWKRKVETMRQRMTKRIERCKMTFDEASVLCRTIPGQKPKGLTDKSDFVEYPKRD